jgi:hypothetical protein
MAFERKVSFDLEPKFEKPVKMLEGLFSAHEFLIPLSFQMAKHKYEFWHMVMVPIAYKGVIDKMSEVGDIESKTHEFLNSGVMTSHLHDIGKFGIVEGSINKSLEVMNFVDPDFVVSESQLDGRPPEIRAAQHLHPLVGGYMVNYLIEKGLIPPEIGLKIKSGVYSHHETYKDSFKPPYPRRLNGRRLEHMDRRQVLSNFLVMLTDVAVSMRSVRPYRNQELDYGIIEKELSLYLQDDELLAYIQPLFNKDIGTIKAILQKNTISAVESIDDLIRDVPDLSRIDWNGYAEVPEEIKFDNMISDVWNVNRGALENAYVREYARDFVHLTRLSLQV